jgi:hypothetical protein
MMEMIDRVGGIGEAVVADDRRNKGIAIIAGLAVRGSGSRTEQRDQDGEDHRDPEECHEDYQEKHP